jgi:hypothetical protein
MHFRAGLYSLGAVEIAIGVTNSTMTKPQQKPGSEQCSEAETIRRRDAAVRRALNTPPKPLKDMKKAKAKKKRQDAPTASEKRT